MIRNFFRAAITFIMASLLYSSCTHEELSVPGSSRDLIVATMETPAATRTAMGDAEDGTNAVGILWTADDQIGVFGSNANSQKCYSKTSESSNKADATFAVTGAEAFSEPQFAYYPYSPENDGKSMTSLVGNLPCEQNMDSGNLYGDYKYGRAVESSEQGHKFVFAHLFSMARIQVDASNTPLAGQKLKTLSVTVNRGSECVNIAGEFTFNAINGDWKQTVNLRNSITLSWNDGPVLGAEPFTCYASLFPTIEPGDEFTIEVTTKDYRAVFTATSKVNFRRENIYTFPVTLRKYENIKVYDSAGKEVDFKNLYPVLNSFGFNVSQNSGKLLNNKLEWNSSKHTPSFTEVKDFTANIDDNKNEITLTIPYLYDFKLKPVFSSNVSKYKVTANGVEQTSGTTEVDFSKPVIYTITNTENGYSREYTVKITNTGLPVVVIEQSGTGDFSDEKVGGKTILGMLIGYRVVNTFVDFKIRGKDTKWVKDDKITVYNADGTVNVTTNGGVRHRGNTSRDYPKKPFAIKTTSAVSMLGMPEHKRWVLLANWLDHSMIRNTVAFDIAHVIEHAWRSSGSIGEGIPWNVHGQNVELVFIENGEAHHVGNYLLCEQSKIDENRLKIKEPYDIESPGADDYTLYGHLLEVDATYDENSKFKTSKSVPFMFKDDVSSTILNDVQSKIQTIETNIYNGDFDAAFENLDINSVIDQMLIWELTMNREYGDPKSVYMFMNGAGKLSAGPVWDFDRGTFQNQEEATELCDNSGPEGSSGKLYRIKPDNEWMYWRTWENETQSYIWYQELAKSATFQQTVKERWAILKPYLDMIPDQIRYYGETQAVSYKYDSAMWPTTKDDIRKYKSDFNDWSGDELLGANGNYQEVIENFVTVYNERLAGMDALITSGKFTK